jgi:hypothetical protein
MKNLFKNLEEYDYLIPVPAILLILFRSQFLENSIIVETSKLINLRPQDLWIFFTILPFLFLNKKMRLICIMFYLIYFFQTR